MRRNVDSLLLVIGLFGWLDLWSYFFEVTPLSAQETTVITEPSPGPEVTPEFIQTESNVQCGTCGGGTGGPTIIGGRPTQRPPGRP
jgi:hypothetical protein